MTETNKSAKTFIYTPSRESFGEKRPFGSFRSSKTASERASRYVATLPAAISGSRGHDALFASLAFSLTDLRYRTGKCGLSSTNTMPGASRLGANASCDTSLPKHTTFSIATQEGTFLAGLKNQRGLLRRASLAAYRCPNRNQKYRRHPCQTTMSTPQRSGRRRFRPKKISGPAASPGNWLSFTATARSRPWETPLSTPT